MYAGCASYYPYACYACATFHGDDAFDHRHGDHASHGSHGSHAKHGAGHRPWRQRFASKPPPAVAFMGRFGFEALGCSAVRF